MLLEGLAKRGHEVFLLAAAVPMPIIPIEGVTEWRFSNILDVAEIDTVIHSVRPDGVFLFGCTAAVIQYLHLRSPFGNCPTFFWLPYEGSIVPKDSHLNFVGVPQDRAVHLTQFARDLWKDICPSEHVIPHGVDTSLFSHDASADRGALRDKWSERLKYPLFRDSLIVFNGDRNIWHKRWDATFDFCRRLQERYPEKKVTLIAHTRARQEPQKGHPPGYDLKYLESVYKFDRVAYTSFDWGNSLKREELAELLRVCDFRLTTSMGEGFGVPTIEAASVGVPQIVSNHTTMPELLGADSLSLVDPAMLEDKMGSLWPVPDVASMVDRASEFVEDPALMADTAEQCRLRIDGLYDADTVCDQFDQLFREEPHKGEAWYRWRWGWRKNAENNWNMLDAARVCSKIQKRPTVLEIGSWDGRFVSACAELSLEVVGIEADSNAIQMQPPRARMYMMNQPYSDAWPNADVVVMTDLGELLMQQDNGKRDLLQSVLSRITQYPWAFLRFRPCYIWGVPLLRPDSLRAALSEHMHRREDLEQLARNKFKNFTHEIWRRGSGVTRDVPATLAE